MCKEKCNNDPECGAIECGGDKDHSTCAWWKFDKCTDKNSPDFFTYTKEQYHYGYTCYKGKNVNIHSMQRSLNTINIDSYKTTFTPYFLKFFSPKLSLAYSNGSYQSLAVYGWYIL